MSSADNKNLLQSSWFAPWRWDRDRWISILCAGGLIIVSLPVVDVILSQAGYPSLIDAMIRSARESSAELLDFVFPRRCTLI